MARNAPGTRSAIEKSRRMPLMQTFREFSVQLELRLMMLQTSLCLPCLTQIAGRAGFVPCLSPIACTSGLASVCEHKQSRSLLCAASVEL